MNLLIIDKDIESQKRVADRIKCFERSDVEMMDIRVKLSSDSDYISAVIKADVLIIGPCVGPDGPNIIRSALLSKADLHVIMFTSEKFYSGGSFREAHSAGVRKVLLESSAPLDLLQELVAIFMEFRKVGRIRNGRLLCVTHAKGGVGATSISAALAELCGINRKRTLLWDMDIETRDLCRSLAIGSSANNQIISSWLADPSNISRDSLNLAVVPINEDVVVLPPPESLSDCLDLICHTDSIQVVQSILDVARVVNDTVIVDVGGKLTPATAAILRAADEVLIVTDSSLLSLTALDLFLNYIKILTHRNDLITFLINCYEGKGLSIEQIESELEPVHNLGDRPWRLPPVPIDTTAKFWPGSGRGFYGSAQKSTRAALEEIAVYLQIILVSDVSFSVPSHRTKWWDNLPGNEEVGAGNRIIEQAKPVNRLSLPGK